MRIAPTTTHGNSPAACVQLARAFAVKPELLLMDEPFGALDAMTREILQVELRRIQRKSGATIIFITHDVDEAVFLADRLVVLKGKPASIGLDVVSDLPVGRDQPAQGCGDLAAPA